MIINMKGALFFLLAAAPAANAFTVKSPVNNGSSRYELSQLEMGKKIFIDGEAGTTGLQVRERLAGRDDIEILTIPNDLRKDEAARKEYINKADAVILCKSKMQNHVSRNRLIQANTQNFVSKSTR